jgi:hypothetical protein
MQQGQGWRTENSNRHFPFLDGGGVPKSFISDIKFFHDRRTQSEVKLSEVSFNGSVYSLTFRHVGDNSIAIAGSVPKNHNKKIVYIFGENQESVVMFSTGDYWHNQQDPFSATYDGKINPDLTSSGPNLIRRIVIDGSSDPSANDQNWRKESTQAIVGGDDIIISKQDNEEILQPEKPTIYISADSSFKHNFTNNNEETGIHSINGIFSSSGNFKINTFDCIKKIERPGQEDHSIKIKSDCLPCCGCSSYQLVSDAITYRSQKLAEMCESINQILNTSSDQYNQAIIKIYESSAPVARIRSIRVYRDEVRMALQNICALPIYGHYGVSFYGVPMVNSSPPSVSVAPLAAPTRFNQYTDQDPTQIPSGAFTGTLGPIPPGGYVDLRFTAPSLSDDSDLRKSNFNIFTEANGYFGQIPMLGCKKDSYNIEVQEDNSMEHESCNISGENVRYKVTEIELP